MKVLIYAFSLLLSSYFFNSLLGVESATWLKYQQTSDHSGPNALPDFSYAGYQQGEKAIPDVKEKIFNVVDFGAVPNDHQSDEAAIRLAVAEKAGGGVVFFPPGVFDVWTTLDKSEPIVIRSSHLVVRGSGSTAGGTVLHFIHHGATSRNYKVPKEGQDFENIKYLFQVEPKVSANDDEVKGTKLSIVKTVLAGSRELTVKEVGGIKAGDWLTLNLKSKDILNEMLDNQVLNPKWSRIAASGVTLTSIHQVASVNGNQITLRQPVKMTLDEKDNPTATLTEMYEEVGFEDLSFRGNYYGRFLHHQTYQDDEAWDALRIKNVANGWVRRCTFINCNTSIYLKGCAYFSILENRICGTPSHYSITVRSGSTSVLNGLVEDLAGQAHGPSVGNYTCDIVMWRWILQKDESVDSHANMPRHTLVDCVEGGTFMRCGGPEPAFPHHLLGLVFWNFIYDGTDSQPIDIWTSPKSGGSRFVKPWVVGMTGKPITFVEENLKINESYGRSVSPESLYEAQLALRLGQVPAWVAQVKKDFQALRKSPLPGFNKRGDWANVDNNTFFLETVSVDDLLAELKIWAGAFEKTKSITLAYEPTPLSLPTDGVLLHFFIQNLIYSFGNVSSVKIKVEKLGEALNFRFSTEINQEASKSKGDPSLEKAEARKEVTALAPLLKIKVNLEDASASFTIPL